MKRSPLSLLGLICSALAGCSSALPPAPPPEPSAASVPQPPPPPPKCEAMKEQCKAGADTAARIPGTDLVFTPPKGWVYAQLEEATVAQRGEKGAVLLLTTYQRVGASLKRTRKRTELIGSLSELVELQPRGGKVVLFRPNEKNEIAGLEMSLWERSGAHRAGDEGSLLVLESDVGERTLFGVGFAPKDDTAGTSAILSAIDSLRSGSGKSEAAERGRADSGESEDEQK